MELKNLGKEILDFFEGINEYDTRLYLRDCIDIRYFNRKEMKSSYPHLIFSFLSVAKMANDTLDEEYFYHYINERTCQDESELFRWIYKTVSLGMRKINEIENEIIYKKWLKTQNEEITA